MQIELHQLVAAIGAAVDLVGIDDFHHGRRVGYMAACVGAVLGWSPERCHLLTDTGILHDVGVSSTRVHQKLLRELEWEGAEEHCLRGEALLRDFAPLAALAPYIRWHHTRWENLATGLSEDVKLIANLIFLTDRVDVLAAPHYAVGDLLDHTAAIRERIEACRGTLFSPQLVDAFLTASGPESFWLMLDSELLQAYFEGADRPAAPQEISGEGLKQCARIFARIVDAKSAYTVAHSEGVARLSRMLAGYLGLGEERCDKIEVAGLLHDLGKLAVPDEILESPDPLTPRERNLMKRHSFVTYQVLQRLHGLEDVAAWAAYHHESLDGGGYPFRLKGAEIPLEARIIRVADIFQAMHQDRPYRSPMAVAAIMDHIHQLTAQGVLDPGIVQCLAAHAEEAGQLSEVAA